MNERQAILQKVNDLTDNYCTPCDFNNDSSHGICKFDCLIGQQLQEYGKQLIGGQEPEPIDPLIDMGFSKKMIKTIRSTSFKVYLRLRSEGYSRNKATKKMKIDKSYIDHYVYVENVARKKDFDVYTEIGLGRFIPTSEKVKILYAEGLTPKAIAHKLGIKQNTVYTYRKERING